MESQKKNTLKFRPNSSLKLMDQIREVLRYHHYSHSTEQTYCQWILRSIYYFSSKTHPETLGSAYWIGYTFCYFDSSSRNSLISMFSSSSSSAFSKSRCPALPSGALSRFNIFPNSARENTDDSRTRRAARARASA